MINLNPKKILIPVDFSDISIQAVKHGAAIAKLFDGEIILLNVQKKADLLDIILPALNVDDPQAINDFIKNKLEAIARPYRTENYLKVETKVLWGTITGKITEYAEDNDVDLIIMGTHGSDSAGDFILGSNSYRVLVNSDIPVMTIREPMDHIGFTNILVPIDSSEHSRQKVNAAIKVAEKFGARLHVLGLLGKFEENYEYKLKVILPQIKKLAGKKHVMCSTEIDRATNRAEKTIEYAKKINADLIIIMSDQSEGISSFILGTYAHQLINNSHVPVLSIQPEVHPETMEEAVIGGMWSK